MDGDHIAERFALGRPVSAPVVAATGWGYRNRVWRLDTVDGTFAVKDTIRELLPADPAESFRVERLAFDAGIPAPQPVPSSTGSCYELVDGRWYRCHRWMDGTAKQNEATTTDDAVQMDGVVARLHCLAIPVEATQSRLTPFGREHWSRLAARRPGAAWARSIENHLHEMIRSERLAASLGDASDVGSHCDLNAHNVLFTTRGLALIDWDAAGPISTRYERGLTATWWAQREHGRLDVEAATAFLAGYRDAGGVVELDDVAELPRWLGALSWWTERNIQIAIERPSDHHDELADRLVTVLANGTESNRERQRFLAEAIARL